MARITIGDVKTSWNVQETYDIVNMITNEVPAFKNYVPLATASNIAEVGAGILINQQTQNDFIVNLVNRIGLVVIRSASLKNPLAKFKKGMLPLGQTIEEIFTDITSGHKYDAYEAEETLFKRSIPNVKSLYHELNRQDRYDQTIQDDSLRSAFVSWNNFESFLSTIINSMYNAAEVEEYEYMKLLIDNYYSKGLFTVVKTPTPDTETNLKELVKLVRATARKMTLPMGSRDFNALAVRQRSEMSDLHLLIDADLEAALDVDVLAKAFNMDRTTFLGHVTIIDGFSSSGLDAVLIDKDFYMVYDRLHNMETVRNAKGLYWNYFYHIWQVLSVSRFANAVAFVSGDVPNVTQVIVDPTILSVKAGRSHKYNVYIRQSDKEVYVPVWTVTGRDGTTVDVGTTIDTDGKLTVAATQTGSLLVTATVTYDDGTGTTTDVDITGESIVTVIP